MGGNKCNGFAFFEKALMYIYIYMYVQMPMKIGYKGVTFWCEGGGVFEWCMYDLFQKLTNKQLIVRCIYHYTCLTCGFSSCRMRFPSHSKSCTKLHISQVDARKAGCKIEPWTTSILNVPVSAAVRTSMLFDPRLSLEQPTLREN